MIGASTEPPRPMPTAKPVPNARTCVGNAWAKIAYMPTIAAFVTKPATQQISGQLSRDRAACARR